MTSSSVYTASRHAPGTAPPDDPWCHSQGRGREMPVTVACSTSTPERCGRFLSFHIAWFLRQDASDLWWRVSHRPSRVDDEEPVRLMGLKGFILMVIRQSEWNRDSVEVKYGSWPGSP